MPSSRYKVLTKHILFIFDTHVAYKSNYWKVCMYLHDIKNKTQHNNTQLPNHCIVLLQNVYITISEFKPHKT